MQQDDEDDSAGRLLLRSPSVRDELRARGTPQLARDEIKYDEEGLVGEGGFAKVYRGTCRGFQVAVKVPKAGVGFDEDQIAAIRDEVDLMSKMYHPHIALFMGAYISKNGQDWMIVSELLTCDVREILLDPQKYPLSLYDRFVFACQVAEGLSWLHGAGVVHMDVKPKNMLYDARSKSIKVCDFGLSKFIGRGGTSKLTEARGTPLYTAPEVMRRQPISDKADVYIERPFISEDPMQCPPTLRTLCAQCWNDDVDQRPSFADILPQLGSIQAECAIFDDNARSEWIRHFSTDKGLLQTVEWDTFYPCILPAKRKRAPTHSQKAVQSLRLLFCRNDDDVVKLQRWGHIVGFFPPLQTAAQWSRMVVHTLSRPWFWGATTAPQADQALAEEANGTFLVRFSSSGSNLTLSYVKGRRIWHTRILHPYASASYALDGSDEVHTTLEALVTAMIRSKVEGLKTPCPGGPFTPFFVKKSRNTAKGYTVAH